MFEKNELEFILLCVDGFRAQSTQVAKFKGHLLFKLSELIDAPSEEPKIKEEEE